MAIFQIIMNEANNLKKIKEGDKKKNRKPDEKAIKAAETQYNDLTSKIEKVTEYFSRLLF